MAWNLDIEDYTNDELMELFNINGVDSNDTKARSLITALQKVQNDKTKTQDDLKDFKNFVNNVSKKLKIDESEFNYQLNNLPEMNVIQESFSQKQPVSIVNDHVLITNKSRLDAFKYNQQGREADENREPPGQINPIKVHTIYKALNIDSRFRDNYYTTMSSDFNILLPNKITDCVKIQLSNLVLPLSFYNYSESKGNTTFVITVTRNGPSTTRYVITIPDGNYRNPFDTNTNLVSIKDIINTVMGTAGINTTTELFYDIDKISGKSIFNTPNGSPVTSFKVEFACGKDGVILNNDNLQYRFGWSLGFRLAEYSVTSSPIAINSESICDTVDPKYIFLAVDDYQPSAVYDYFTTGFQSSLLPNNILTRIDIGKLSDNQGYFTLGDVKASTTSVNVSRSYFGPVSIEKLRITLYDESGRVLDLNNMDWSVSFSFTSIYQQS
jgi:hypothetical protein